MSKVDSILPPRRWQFELAIIAAVLAVAILLQPEVREWLATHHSDWQALTRYLGMALLGLAAWWLWRSLATPLVKPLGHSESSARPETHWTTRGLVATLKELLHVWNRLSIDKSSPEEGADKSPTDTSTSDTSASDTSTSDTSTSDASASDVSEDSDVESSAFDDEEEWEEDLDDGTDEENGGRAVRRTKRAGGRRVDLALARSGRKSHLAPSELPECGRTYRLNVQIGRRFRQSLFLPQQRPPSVDSMLPPAPSGQGHRLSVVVYGLDWEVIGANVQELTLPERGPSKTVSFELRTPAAPGPVRFRVAIYYEQPIEWGTTASEPSANPAHNQLVQSFLVESQAVTPTSTIDLKWRTHAQFEACRSQSFQNLRDWRPRVISLGLNRGGTEPTHTVMLKQAGSAAEIQLLESELKTCLTKARQTLTAAVCDPTGDSPRFDRPDQTEFDQTIAALAGAGEDLYRQVFRKAKPGTREALNAVRDSADGVIQVVRFDVSQLFPWALIYDFRLPERLHGLPSLPVCDGYLRRDEFGKPFSCRQCLENCLCPHQGEKICVYGFWGLRHQVEQLLIPDRIENTVTEVEPWRDGAVHVVVAFPDGIAATLPGNLLRELGDKLVTVHQPAEELHATLWDDELRPAVLVVLGHYVTEIVAGESEEPRITLPGEKLLTAHQFDSRVIHDGLVWSRPRSIVVLAACEGVASDMTRLTSFLDAFASAGAGGVIGSETVLFETFACRMAFDLTTSLARGQAMGAAILEWRRALLQEWNPLGFIITPYGDADLHCVVGTSNDE